MTENSMLCCAGSNRSHFCIAITHLHFRVSTFTHKITVLTRAKGFVSTSHQQNAFDIYYVRFHFNNVRIVMVLLQIFQLCVQIRLRDEPRINVGEPETRELDM